MCNPDPYKAHKRLEEQISKLEKKLDIERTGGFGAASLLEKKQYLEGLEEIYRREND